MAKSQAGTGTVPANGGAGAGAPADIHRGRQSYLPACLLLLSLSLACAAAGPLLVVSDAPHEADAIVVIGGDHKPARVQRAVDLYRQGYAPVVLISAGTIVQEGNTQMPEAEVMQRQALALGLPGETIILETASRTTHENALQSKRLCRQHGFDSILLVTSAYHSRRAGQVFRDVFEPEISVSVQAARLDHPAPLWWLYPDQAYVVLYEYWNWILYTLG